MKTKLISACLIGCLMACGVAPSPVTVNPSTTYSDLNKALCPDGDDDKDGLCNKYELETPSLGSQCIGDDDCNNDDVKDGDDPEHEKNNTMGYILGGVGGAVLATWLTTDGKIGEAWNLFKKGEVATHIAPDGSDIEITGAQLNKVSSVFRLENVNNVKLLKHVQTASLSEPLRIKIEDKLFKTGKYLQVCQIATYGVTSVNGSDVSMQFEIKGSETKTEEVEANDDGSKDWCMNKHKVGTYVKIDEKKARWKKPTFVGFQNTLNAGTYGRRSKLIFVGLEGGDLGKVKAYFTPVESSSAPAPHEIWFENSVPPAPLNHWWNSILDVANRAHALVLNYTTTSTTQGQGTYDASKLDKTEWYWEYSPINN